MKQFWIAFEKDKGIVPWLIRKFMKFDYNHICLVYESEDWKEKWVTEAVYQGGVRAVPLMPHRKMLNIYRVEYDIADDVRAVQKLITQHYSVASLLFFGFFILLRDLFGNVIRFPTDDPPGQMCSEYLARILHRKFAERFENPQWVSPKDLDTHMKESKVYFEFCGESFS